MDDELNELRARVRELESELAKVKRAERFRCANIAIRCGNILAERYRRSEDPLVRKVAAACDETFGLIAEECRYPKSEAPCAT